MKEPYKQLFCDMLAAFDECRQPELSEKETAEKCFWMSRSYGKKLKELMKNIDFNDEEEEIDFFRNVKPQFVHHIEYYLLVSEALSFVSVTRGDVIAFWEEEKNRFNKFCEDHEAFIKYYQSGEHDLDKTYFLRENNNFKFDLNLHIYDTDVDWCTSHDRLVRNYLAYGMYSGYCEKKLRNVNLVY